ncbi:hypothetical protein KQX54_006153 [Cotesia glomerata]|uniref:Secreted protein n=1 Tax=Cotesia glomerata TaxID=32391 RepID=A0AAV7I4E2_COTGL|nr:hypothetical protein KQX54_006153 [Cotesia glomerata]
MENTLGPFFLAVGKILSLISSSFLCSQRNQERVFSQEIECSSALARNEEAAKCRAPLPSYHSVYQLLMTFRGSNSWSEKLTSPSGDPFNQCRSVWL